MAPSTAEGSPAPFLNGAHGRLARPKPQLEDDASATDLRNRSPVPEKTMPTQRNHSDTRVSKDGERRRRDERGDELT